MLLAASLSLSHPVLLWDLDSTSPSRIWSPNTLRTRGLLILRGIPFTTRFITVDAVEKNMKQTGVEPNAKVPHYTLPAITHNGTTVMGTEAIVAYLEKTFPDHLSAYPTPGAEAEAAAMESALPRIYATVLKCAAGFSSLLQEPQAREFMHHKFSKRDAIFDVSAFMQNPKKIAEEWEAIRQFYNNFEVFTEKHFSPDQLARVGTEAFLFGLQATYADITYFSMFYWVRVAYTQDASQTEPLLTNPWMKAWLQLMSVYAELESPVKL